MKSKAEKPVEELAKQIASGFGNGENIQRGGNDNMCPIKLVGPTLIALFQKAEQMYLFGGVF